MSPITAAMISNKQDLQKSLSERWEAGENEPYFNATRRTLRADYRPIRELFINPIYENRNHNFLELSEQIEFLERAINSLDSYIINLETIVAPYTGHLRAQQELAYSPAANLYAFDLPTTHDVITTNFWQQPIKNKLLILAEQAVLPGIWILPTGTSLLQWMMGQTPVGGSLLGFALAPILWKKLNTRYTKKNLNSLLLDLKIRLGKQGRKLKSLFLALDSSIHLLEQGNLSSQARQEALKELLKGKNMLGRIQGRQAYFKQLLLQVTPKLMTLGEQTVGNETINHINRITPILSQRINKIDQKICIQPSITNFSANNLQAFAHTGGYLTLCDDQEMSRQSLWHYLGIFMLLNIFWLFIPLENLYFGEEDAPKSLLDKRLLMLCATWVMFAKEFLLPAASTRGRKIESAKVWPFLEKVQQQEAVIQNQLNWVNNLPENTDTWKKLTDAYHQLKFSKREITRTMNLGKITGDKHLFQAINAQKQSLEETLSNLKQTIENLEKKLYNPLIYRN